MSLAIATVIDKYVDTKRGHLIFTITPSGTYPTGGDTLNLSGLMPGSSLVPTWVEINGVSGFFYSYVNGTTQANGKVKVFVEQAVATNTPLAEHSNAAYVAGVTGDTITVYCEFKLR